MSEQEAEAVASKSSGKASFLVCGFRFDVDKKYKLLQPIGHGAYGIVCSAINLEAKQKVAIKKITKAFGNPVEAKRTLREVKLLRHLQHVNILKILDIMKPDSADQFDELYVVTELMSTDLHKIITSTQPLTEDHAQYFIYQILRGLKYIHSAHVIHRDIKPSNLLLNANCDLKICDLGLARLARPDESQQVALTEYVATRWYRAPEIMLSWREYSNAIDVWSCGCILAEILGRKPLFPGRDFMHQIHMIIDVLGTPSYADTEYIISAKAKEYIRSLPFKKGVPFKKLFPNASEDALDLLSRMLTFSPEKRITVEEALRHPYLKLLHDPSDEPSSEAPFSFEFENLASEDGLPLEGEELKQTLKALLWDEIAEYHPDIRDLPVQPVRPRLGVLRHAAESEQKERGGKSNTKKGSKGSSNSSSSMDTGI